MPEPITLPPLRVLVVTPKSFIAGAELWLLSVLDGTKRLDVRVVVLDEDGELIGELASRGIDTALLPTGPGGADLARASLRLRADIDEWDPDVVMANGIKAAAAAIPPAWALGVPTVWVRHDPSFDRTLGSACGRLASRVIMVAPPTADESRRFDPTFIPPPLLTVPLDAGVARKELEELGVPDDGLRTVGMFCRLSRYKGIDTAIRALSGAPDWRLVVAGIVDPGERGDELQRLRGIADEAGVADRVTWLGNVTAAGRLAAGLDAVAIMTRSGEPGYPDAEGFGMNLIEAYSAGTPLIADPRTVPPLQWADYTAGAILVDATDPHDVAAALLALQGESPEITARRADAARTIADAHPRPADVAEAVVAELARAAHRPGAGASTGPAMSVVSTVFNEGEAIEVLLDDVLAQLRPSDEFVVVDGGSSDQTLQRLRRRSIRDPRLVVISHPGAGISEGRNIGIEAARHRWIACTDAGCRLTGDWLDGFRAAAADGTAELVTGVYRADPGQLRLWETALVAVAYPRPEELRRQTPWGEVYGRLFGRVYDAALPTGRSVAFTKEAWRAAGGFPEDLATGEDVTFGQSAVAAGASAQLAVDAEVVWGQRESFRANNRMFYRYGIGDGQSKDKRLIGRNLARLAAYTVGPALLVPSRTRPLAIAAAAVYFSVPAKRALTGPRPIGTAAMVPAVTAARDLSKAYGCLVGLKRGR